MLNLMCLTCCWRTQNLLHGGPALPSSPLSWTEARCFFVENVQLMLCRLAFSFAPCPSACLQDPGNDIPQRHIPGSNSSTYQEFCDEDLRQRKTVLYSSNQALRLNFA